MSEEQEKLADFMGKLDSKSENTTNNWFYKVSGSKIGPIPREQIIELIKTKVISCDNFIWQSGSSTDWCKITETEFNVYLNTSVPPPLPTGTIKNSLVWILAFLPLIGFFLEYMIASMIHDDEYADVAVENGDYWYITLILNIVFAYWDFSKLKKSGYNMDKLTNRVWLVPVYLFQRARLLKQNYAYFIVWIICFVILVMN